MTLEEAIRHAEDVAKSQPCSECADEHKQLAEGRQTNDNGGNQMTPEEALEVCKIARDRIIDDDGYLNTVIQALEKQVPKPVEDYQLEPTHFAKCPSCGRLVTIEVFWGLQFCDKFCWNCGQAISWTHENGEEETK